MREQFSPTSPLVSVVMVAHDAEGSVRRAVESLQRQTLKNFELICVDQGSVDATLRQLVFMAEREPRLEILDGEGLSRNDALNKGLARARGTYLCVMDADGWLEPGALESFVDAAEKDALELVIGGWALMVSVADGRTSAVEIAAEPATFSASEDFRAVAWHLFATGQLLPASAKLFSLERVRELELTFRDDSPSDHGFVVEYLRDAEHVGVVGGVAYRLQRMLSPAARGLAGPNGYRALEEEHAALEELYGHWELVDDPAAVRMIQTRYVEQLAGCIENICGWGTAVSSAEQKKLVAAMIGSERAQYAASVAQPQGNSGRSLIGPMRSGNVSLICVQARLMSLIRRGAVPEVVPDAFL